MHPHRPKHRRRRHRRPALALLVGLALAVPTLVLWRGGYDAGPGEAPAAAAAPQQSVPAETVPVRYLYTANAGDGTVSVVDTATGVVTARVPTGTAPTSVAVLPDGSRVLVTHGDGTVRVLATA